MTAGRGIQVDHDADWLQDEDNNVVGYQKNQREWVYIPRYSTDPSGNPTGLVGPGGGLLGFGAGVYGQLARAEALATGKNPFDFPSTATQPLVSSITVGAAAYAAPKTYSYGTADGTPRLPILGAPYADTTLSLAAGSGYYNGRGVSTASGSGYAGLAFTDNVKGSQFLEVLVTAASMQVDVRGVGLSSNYFPIIVNGVVVAPGAPAAISDGAIQIDFSTRGTYRVQVGMEQSLALKGVTVSEDDTVHPQGAARMPVVVYGDSYTAGTVSPLSSSITGMGLCGALSLIGGINAIPCGLSGSGYVNDGGVSLPLTNTQRLQLVAALVTASGAPLVMIPAGYNDVSTPSTTAAVQAAATIVINYLLANTTASILIYGAQPGNRNNSANTQLTDAGLLAAVTAANSSRVAFIPVAGAAAPWISGTRSTGATTGGTAGNSRYYTGNDAIHPSPFFTAVPFSQATTTPSSGIEYMARRMLDAAKQTAKARQW